MTSCPLSLKAIPAHNSSQRDIKLPLERMSTMISLNGENRSKRERERKKVRERAKEREGNSYIIL
jgi:hypothetical protein